MVCEVLVDGLWSTFGWLESYYWKYLWMVCEVLVPVQGHPSHFPAQWGPASHPTLPGGGKAKREFCSGADGQRGLAWGSFGQSEGQGRF